MYDLILIGFFIINQHSARIKLHETIAQAIESGAPQAVVKLLEMSAITFRYAKA